MRQLIGLGTPRGLQGRRPDILVTLWVLLRTLGRWVGDPLRIASTERGLRRLNSRTAVVVNSSATATFATGC